MKTGGQTDREQKHGETDRYIHQRETEREKVRESADNTDMGTHNDETRHSCVSLRKDLDT